MNGAAGFDLDLAAVRRSFDRAARSYDGSAVLQSRVREELLARLDYVTLEPATILDVGCGTGHATRALKDRYPRARVIALDVSEGMLAMARRRQSWRRRFDRVCGDAMRLPLATGSVDLVFSSLTLQWCPDLDAVFAGFRQVLAPRGLVNFATFGPDTLTELRTAWAQADGLPHVNQFTDMHDLGDGLVRAGLAEPVLDVERYTLTYPDVYGLMRDLKAIGAHNVNAGRPRGMTGRGRLRAMESAYERYRQDGSLPATYEVVFGQAWGPAGEGRRGRRGGEFTLDPAAIGRRSREA
ncbi:MAG: malonyl-[acyl-carrier protein] O-methyltransferase BioC [Gammaproteobacteria bacterium SG8_30]|jgi:malonyl-CoA O-methyltransferase|nr:MAG: malonyl-[acyl-carrier protein] O-methyltransferase BioC [Gammaproteobacteria bacterium SG8_30]